MAAMASMTLQLGAVAPGAPAAWRTTLLLKQQLPANSWVCRAASNDEGTMTEVSQAVSDVATTVQEVGIDVYNDLLREFNFISLLLFKLSIFRNSRSSCFSGHFR